MSEEGSATEPTRGRPGRGAVAKLALGARIAVSAALLALVAYVLDVREVLARLGDLRWGWVAAGLALSVAQVVLLAWRWRFTAARLGVALPLGEAVREYYMGIFINQVVPGGVVGDVSRAWRHARTPAPTGPAVRAVVLERLSAQLIMTEVALLSVVSIPPATGVGRFGVIVAVVLASVGLLVARLRSAPADSVVGRSWADTHRAILARGALSVQVGTGVLAVASYIAMYLVAARAVGSEAPLGTMLPLVAPILMAMLIPVTVSGWGAREGAAGFLWGIMSLPPEEGVAISVAYGLLVLASSAPGLVVLSGALLGGRSRTARPARAGSDGTEAAAPRPGSRPDPG